MLYTCTDGSVDIEIEAETATEAAQEYVDGGDWGRIEGTTWITVWVDEVGDDEYASQRIKITLDPEEPSCEPDQEHDWRAPYELLGGLRENPGVWGSGGGVKYTMVCMNCGCGKHVNTWAQDPNDGEQGLDSVSYEPGEFTVKL